MGFFQATNGIDSKANVLITGSLFASTNVNAVETVSGNNISSSGDIVIGDDLFIKGIEQTPGTPSAIYNYLTLNPSTGQVYFVPTASAQTPPHVVYDGQTGGTASYDANSTPSISQLMNGVIAIFPASNPMLELDFSGITTDYKVEIISYGTGVNAERMNLQIRTPNTGNGWDGWLTGYYTDVAQSVAYQWITSGNGNTLFNTLGAVSRRLDSSSRTLISIDIQLKEIIVHCTNISD
jgi:hypothetical protein